MPLEVSDAGEALFALMPHYYREDPAAQAIIDPVARELKRLEEFLKLVQNQWYPQNAADDYGQLGLREEQLGIPVEPQSLSVEQRRQIVAAYEQARLSGSGEDWIILLTMALGATIWEHDENDPGDYDLRLTIPYEELGFSAGQVEALADVVTPAHLNIALTYSEGFIVGINRLGDSM
jgi:uncharacterized protein DUF2313